MNSLNYTAPINQLGYGHVGFNILKEMVRQEVRVGLFPIGQPSVSNQEDAALVQGAIKNSEWFDIDAPSLRLWHQFDMAQHVGYPRIGFPIYEMDRLTELEKHQLRTLHGICVPSHWHKEQLALDGIEGNVSVVPLGYDPDIFFAAPPEVRTKEMNFFTAGKWEVRKGHDVLVEAFCQAFEPKDKVALWMMCENPFLDEKGNDEWRRMYKESPMGHCINFVPRVESHYDVAKIMRQMDAGVFISRAEGWNMELLEMMACGKPCMATMYSAHCEFFDEDCGPIVLIDREEEAYDGKWFLGEGSEINSGKWAHLGSSQVDDMVSGFRRLYENRGEGYDLGRIKQFTWTNTVEKLKNAIDCTVI